MSQQNGKTQRSEVDEVTRALAAAFEPNEVKFRPAAVSGNRAMALAYVDARAIQDRLDEVLGVDGWQDDYECRDDGSVVCRLRLRLGGEWVTKVDVGGPSEQPDGGDRLKAAFSDALKRAAVKFGIGRYLYRLPALWADYDPQKRQFVRPPVLPGSAGPKCSKALLAVAETPAGKAQHAAPANGEEFVRRLQEYDAKLAADGVCTEGALVNHIQQAGIMAGHDVDLTKWTAPGFAFAAEQTRTFERDMRKRKMGRREVA